MPRNQASPENNIVQNPGVTRGIGRFAGVRQAHVLPALSDGLQAILIAGDVREDPRTGIPESYAATQEIISDGVNVKRATFVNPAGNDKVVVLRRLHVYAEAAALANAVIFAYNLLYPTGFVLSITGQSRGQRLISGFNQTVGGIPQPQPPVNGTDIPFPPRGSACGFHNPPLTGIDGGYFWRGLLNGPAGGEILENFNAESGPRILVFPGGAFQGYALDVNTDYFVNMWWDEYPLS